MYKITFEYSDGKKGVCIENGTVKLFDTEREAVAFASELNESIDDDMKAFFPVYSAVEA